MLGALRAVRELRLPNAYIGAGAIRQLVWDHLHDRPSTPPADIDVVYFDPTDTTAARDQLLTDLLSRLEPDLPWEVTNQAGVHHWLRARTGLAVEPFRSIDEAIGSWPEYATAVGVALDDGGNLDVIAPHGLDDLFGMVVRHNPTRASAAVFRERLLAKRFEQRWPLVRVLTDSNPVCGFRTSPDAV